MEFQGIVLAGIVLFGLFYVTPYLYRRHRVAVDAPLEEAHTESIRLLHMPASNANGDDGRRGDILVHGKGAVVSKEAHTDTRLLVRDRARRRARIAKRETNRNRGIVGVFLVLSLVFAAWGAYALRSLTLVVPILVTLLFVAYSAGLVYLLRMINAANSVDLGVIASIDDELAQARRTSRTTRESTAKARSGKTKARSVAVDDVHGKENLSKKLPARTDKAAVSSRADASRREKAVAVREARSVSAKAARKARTTAPLAPTPSYTLRASTLTPRSIAAYEPPVADETSVPYRPKRLGERLMTPGEIEARNAAATPESAESLAGGNALDVLLARRRA